MKLFYLYKEAIRGFSSAKLSTFASVITIMLSIILISIYFLFTINSSRIIKDIKEKVELEIFLEDELSNEDLISLRDKIRIIGGVKSINYISKDEAVKIFTEEFGSEMLEIYDYNPLPASFRINLYEEYKTIERLNKIKSQLAEMKFVTDVKFPEGNLELIESKTSGFLFINLIIMIVITLSSVFLVSNTIRLIINSRKKIIETFKLLGATRIFVMLPFLFEGFIQGLFGSLLAIGTMYLFLKLFVSKFQASEIKFTFMDADIILYLILTGIALGVLGSYFSVLKYLKIQN